MENNDIKEGYSMRAASPIRLPARLLPLLALAVCLFCCAVSLYRLEHLPDEQVAGRFSGTVREAEEDTLLLDGVQLSGGMAMGRVLLTPDPYSYPLEAGCHIEVEGTLLPLSPPDNPHGWDERTRFLTDGVVYTAQGKILRHEEMGGPSLLSRARNALRSHIDALWTEQSGLITGLLLGAKDGLSDETYEAFRRSGTAHLLAVSGLHVGFVLALVSFCLSGLRKHSALRLILTLLCMAGYALLAESAFSVFRATLMLSAGLLARHWGRRADGLTSLSIAVILVLLLRPAQVLCAGFQLSVCAVLGILFLSERVEALLRPLRPDWLRSSITLTLCAQIGVLPVQLYTFHSLPLLSAAANLAAVPLAAGIVMLGLPTVALHLISPALAAPVAFVVELLSKALLLVCGDFGSLPFAEIHLRAPSILVLLGFLGVLFLLSPYPRALGRSSRRVLAAVLLGTWVLSLAIWLPGVVRSQPPEALFLSVGTADSALLRSSQGNVLIDTGWSGSQAVRALQGEGEELEAVIITHADADHSGGLAHVLENVAVKALYLPLGMPRDGLADALAIAQERGIAVHTLQQGDSLTLGAFSMDVLWPEYVRPGQDNEDSLVLQVRANGCSLLFLSDIPARTEDRLGSPASDVLKLAHHGSGGSSTARTLRLTAPQAAVLSVGTPNRYGFPDPAVLDRLDAAGIPVYRTDELGAVQVRLTPDGPQLCGYTPPSFWQELIGLPS